MNTKAIEAIATAVLYEGYMLYPYRPSSVKNRQRFNFGVLYPRAYSEMQSGSDAWKAQTECLIEGTALTAVEVRVRFLKMVARSVRKLTEPEAGQAANRGGSELVERLEGNGKVQVPWQEAIECEVMVPVGTLGAFTSAPLLWKFEFAEKNETEAVQDAAGRRVGLVARRQDALHGVVEVRAERIADELFKVGVCVKNLSQPPKEDAGPSSRDQTLMRSLVSAHVLLGAVDGQFVSLLDPPENLKSIAAGCHNVGVWPVLVGAEGERSTMLASPVILYDYPQIAPESPGDLFDGTEIDEILALRILTMTDDEKQEMRQTDDRACKMLERTEALPMEHLMKLHGTLRELRPLREEMP